MLPYFIQVCSQLCTLLVLLALSIFLPLDAFGYGSSVQGAIVIASTIINGGVAQRVFYELREHVTPIITAGASGLFVVIGGLVLFVAVPDEIPNGFRSIGFMAACFVALSTIQLQKHRVVGLTVVSQLLDALVKPLILILVAYGPFWVQSLSGTADSLLLPAFVLILIVGFTAIRLSTIPVPALQLSVSANSVISDLKQRWNYLVAAVALPVATWGPIIQVGAHSPESAGELRLVLLVASIYSVVGLAAGLVNSNAILARDKSSPLTKNASILLMVKSFSCIFLVTCVVWVFCSAVRLFDSDLLSTSHAVMLASSNLYAVVGVGSGLISLSLLYPRLLAVSQRLAVYVFCCFAVGANVMFGITVNFGVEQTGYVNLYSALFFIFFFANLVALHKCQSKN